MPAPSLDELRANPGLVDTLPASVLADLYTQVAIVEANLRACLLLAHVSCVPRADEPDQVLDVTEAAAMLNSSKDSLYRKWQHLPFAYKDPLDGKLKFSRRGIERYIATRAGY